MNNNLFEYSMNNNSKGKNNNIMKYCYNGKNYKNDFEINNLKI